MRKRKKYKNYHKNNRRNTSKKPKHDLYITTRDSMNLSKVGKDLDILYEQVSENDVLCQNISGTEQILSEIEKSKCHHLRVLPFIPIGKKENLIYFQKYLTKVLLTHPEYLYYLRPLPQGKYGLIGSEPALIAVVDSSMAYNMYCCIWEVEKDDLLHPHKIIAGLRDYLINIGKSKDEIDLIMDECFDID